MGNTVVDASGSIVLYMADGSLSNLQWKGPNVDGIPAIDVVSAESHAEMVNFDHVLISGGSENSDAVYISADPTGSFMGVNILNSQLTGTANALQVADNAMLDLGIGGSNLQGSDNALKFGSKDTLAVEMDGSSVGMSVSASPGNSIIFLGDGSILNHLVISDSELEGAWNKNGSALVKVSADIKGEVDIANSSMYSVTMGDYAPISLRIMNSTIGYGVLAQSSISSNLYLVNTAIPEGMDAPYATCLGVYKVNSLSPVTCRSAI
jgi:hypothetical protein